MGCWFFVISRRIPPKNERRTQKCYNHARTTTPQPLLPTRGCAGTMRRNRWKSRWHRCRVNELHIEPLDKASPLYGTPSAFAAGISAESVEDTAEKPRSCHAGRWFLLSRPQHGLQKSLLDRAKISGSALPKLSHAKDWRQCLTIAWSCILRRRSCLSEMKKSRQHTPAILWIIPCCRSMNC